MAKILSAEDMKDFLENGGNIGEIDEGPNEKLFAFQVSRAENLLGKAFPADINPFYNSFEIYYHISRKEDSVEVISWQSASELPKRHKKEDNIQEGYIVDRFEFPDSKTPFHGAIEGIDEKVIFRKHEILSDQKLDSYHVTGEVQGELQKLYENMK